MPSCVAAPANAATSTSAREYERVVCRPQASTSAPAISASAMPPAMLSHRAQREPPRSWGTRGRPSQTTPIHAHRTPSPKSAAQTARLPAATTTPRPFRTPKPMRAIVANEHATRGQVQFDIAQLEACAMRNCTRLRLARPFGIPARGAEGGRGDFPPRGAIGSQFCKCPRRGMPEGWPRAPTGGCGENGAWRSPAVLPRGRCGQAAGWPLDPPARGSQARTLAKLAVNASESAKSARSQAGKTCDRAFPSSQR